ncbi:MAG: hypothetical protein AB8B82_05805 [Roseovarius sp.]
MISAIFGGVSAAATPALAAENANAPLSDAQIILAIQDLTGSEAAALAATKAMLAGEVSQHEPFSYYVQDYANVAALGHGLYASNRLLDLDWAAGLDEAVDQFDFILGTSDILWPAGLEDDLDQLVQAGGIARGDAVGEVYIRVWPQVRDAGYQIMSLNTDSDAHMMFIAPEAAALRWQSVQIGPNMYFEIADWQFGTQMQAAGHSIEFPGHPATHPQKAPKP